MEESFKTCLSDYTPVLTELAVIIDANYVSGSFEKDEEEFISSNKSSEDWLLVGARGQLRIRFEKHEGYYFSEFIAAGNSFEKGKELIYKEY